MGIAYLARATSTGAWLDWMLFAVMGLLGSATCSPSSTRARRCSSPTPRASGSASAAAGGGCRGAPGPGRAPPARGVLRDGRLVLVARNPERVLEELDAGGRRQSRIAQRMYGAPFAVPLALTTRVSGAGGDLTDA